MTFPLSITLRDPLEAPIVGATVIVAPEEVNPTTEETVLTSAQGVTDANGQLTLQLLPSTARTFYIMRIDKGTTPNILAPFRFQMPAQATTLNSLLAAAIANQEPVPEGVHVNFPSQPYSEVSYPAFTDINIPVDDAAFTFGDWVDVYHMTNDGTEAATYVVVFDLVFDPDWAYDPGDRAEVDLRLRKVDADGTVLQELEKHNFDYIRNLDESHSKGSIEATGIAELLPNQYIEVDVRGGRQQPSSARSTDRIIKLVGADSSLQVKRETTISPATIRVTVDPATMGGTGSTGSPIHPLVPFTQTEKDKLATVAEGAQPPQDGPAIRDKLEGIQQDADKLTIDSIQGLTARLAQTQPSALNDLSDVTITSPQDGDFLRSDASGQYTNVQFHANDGADIVRILEHRPEGQELHKSALQGQTTVEGGVTVPAVADVEPFTLFARQDSSADNPSLYLAGATYDVPLRDRNRVVLSVDRNGLYSINPQRGSASDNYNSAVGTYAARARAGSGQVTLALYANPAPPTTIYVRGIGGDNNVFALTRSGPGFINGRTYSVYSATIAANVVQNAPNTTQTLTFWSNAAGNTPINLKPASEHHAKAWHLQSPVQPDYAVSDARSPAYIKNKPPTKDPTTIGRLIAKTAALPTTATAFSTAGTISRYTPALTITDAEVTTNYTVSANSALSVGPYPKGQIGWLIRAVGLQNELARVFIPLSPTRPYTSVASLLDDTRVCGHVYMGVSGTVNYYLAYQLSVGTQARPAGSGTIGTNIEVFVAANLATASVAFPAMTTIEITEAVV